MPDSIIVDELLRIVRAAEASVPEPSAEELAVENMRLRAVKERQEELNNVGAGKLVGDADTDELKSMLKNTGRANSTENADGVLGGKRDALAMNGPKRARAKCYKEWRVLRVSTKWWTIVLKQGRSTVARS